MLATPPEICPYCDLAYYKSDGHCCAEAKRAELYRKKYDKEFEEHRKTKEILARHRLKTAKKYMSHTQKCSFKFGECTCGYSQFLEEIND